MKRYLLHLSRLIFLLCLSIGGFLLASSAHAATWSDSGWGSSTLCSGESCSIQIGAEAVKDTVPSLTTDMTATEYITEIVLYFLGFVTLVAVIYVIYAGFQLMIGGGDEEKMKKAKKIIFGVIIGITLMWLAFAIVTWVTTAVTKTTSYRAESKSWISQYLTIPEVSAYTENDIGTFDEYKKRLESSLFDIENEVKTNGVVSASTISTVRANLQNAYRALPDNPDTLTKNEGLKKSVELSLNLTEKSPGSLNTAATLVTDIRRFISEAKIGRISATIEANPSSGNAPLTVTFRATNVTDPSGVQLRSENYIWWTRGPNGGRTELGRGPTLSHTFSTEQTYTVFLDVVSSSRNSKGLIDTLPFSGSKQIEVQPRIGNVLLFVNGVNVSNLSTLKISPSIGKAGLLIDATGSRGSNGTVIQKTKWDFGNENTIVYDGAPQIERQIYANEGKYSIKVELTNNQGQTFQKDLSIIIVDPASVIQLDKTSGFVGESFRMTALSYFSNPTNIKYQWTITDLSQNKKIHSSTETSTNFIFPKIGRYAVTLMAQSANGKTDIDTKEVTIESRNPIVNIESRNVNSETPNIFLLDASKSYDQDTNTRQGLSYSWKVDGRNVTLSQSSLGNAKGYYTFSELGEHTISLSVTNPYGKVSTKEMKIQVNSLLSVALDISPLVIQIGKTTTLRATAPGATFYEWSISDGSANILGSDRQIQHQFQRSGAYEASLTVKSSDGKQTNTITRKIYATDANKPFSLITVKDQNGNPMTEIKNACSGNPAIITNRADTTNIDGSQSINIDGTNNGIIYSWKMNGKNYTSSTLSEKLDELGCFPVELTVKSQKNGSTHSSKQYIQIKNITPTLSSITSTLEASSQKNTNSQKAIINVTANAAQDRDGVIVSYLWYYYTESDSEPQGIKITQSPKTTFVVPNISEKYYFGVILEDNDGAKTNSKDLLKETVPLIIANEDGNINMPLISLVVSSTTAKAGNPLTFEASVKTLMGTDITTKSEYIWDFNGDGIVDKKTTEPKVTHTYTHAGTMNMKLKVVYNGVSNTKYQTISIKNELSPNVSVYRVGTRIFAINTSGGSYEKARWTMGDFISDELGSTSYDFGSVSSLPSSGNLEITDSNGVSKNIDFPIAGLDPTSATTGSGLSLITYPEIQGDTITLPDNTTRLTLSLFQNTATQYVIDEDIRIDSDLDGITDNDIDNRDTPSYTSGAPYTFSHTRNTEKRERKAKITLYQGEESIDSRTITIISSYLPSTRSQTEVGGSVTGSGASDMSVSDKNLIEKLSSEIRSLESEDRGVLMQKYNTLIENWNDTTEKTKMLLDIQEYVDASSIKSTQKTKMGDILSSLLVGEEMAQDHILVSTQLINNLIPTGHPSKQKISEALKEIESHPTNITENKKIIREQILPLLKADTSIDEKYRKIINAHLESIVSGGDTVSTEDGTPDTAESSTLKSLLFLLLKIIAFIVLGLLAIFVLAYIFYAVSNKREGIGFQDFFIDSFHHHKAEPSPAPRAPVVDPLQTLSSPIITPVVEVTTLPSSLAEGETTMTIPSLYEMGAPVETPPPASPVNATTNSMTDGGVPDWLKVDTPHSLSDSVETATIDPSAPVAESTPVVNTLSTVTDSGVSPITLTDTPPSEHTGELPDWLKVDTPHPEDTISASTIETPATVSSDTTTLTEGVETHTDGEKNQNDSTAVTVPSTSETGSLPDWLTSPDTDEQSSPEVTDPLTPQDKAPEILPGEGVETLSEKEKSQNISTPDITPASGETGSLPDWLTAPETPAVIGDSPVSTEESSTSVISQIIPEASILPSLDLTEKETHTQSDTLLTPEAETLSESSDTSLDSTDLMDLTPEISSGAILATPAPEAPASEMLLIDTVSEALPSSAGITLLSTEADPVEMTPAQGDTPDTQNIAFGGGVSTIEAFDTPLSPPEPLEISAPVMTPPVVVPSQSELPDWLRETIAPVDPTPPQTSETIATPILSSDPLSDTGVETILTPSVEATLPPQRESQSDTDTTHTDLDVLMETLTPHQGVTGEESKRGQGAIISEETPAMSKISQKQEVQGRKISSKGAYGSVSDGEVNFSNDEIHSFSEISETDPLLTISLPETPKSTTVDPLVSLIQARYDEPQTPVVEIETTTPLVSISTPPVDISEDSEIGEKRDEALISTPLSAPVPEQTTPPSLTVTPPAADSSLPEWLR